ncbi:hypothetical protein VB002_02400 [Campylobacter concisus]
MKFDISAIFYIKRAIITKDGLERAISEFKKIFLRENSYAILKSLLDAQMIANFDKTDGAYLPASRI